MHTPLPAPLARTSTNLPQLRNLSPANLPVLAGWMGLAHGIGSSARTIADVSAGVFLGAAALLLMASDGVRLLLSRVVVASRGVIAKRVVVAKRGGIVSRLGRGLGLRRGPSRK
jgi:hypothetical protein